MMLLLFYGLPIHIMRDLFITLRDFLKRTSALIRYRQAMREMNQYPDATEEELARENTCIICREEMRPWDPANNPGAVDRVRPKKLPCGHTLHLGCLKSWLERQQVCPTCRSPVSAQRGAANRNRGAAALRFQIGGGMQRPNAQPGGQRQAGAAGGQNPQPQENAAGGQQGRGPRVYRLGPFRLGIGANENEVRQLAQDFGMPDVTNDNNAAGNGQAAANAGTTTTSASQNLHPGQFNHLQEASSLLGRVENMLQCEATNLQARQQELQTAQLLLAELHRLRQRSNVQQNGGPSGAAVSAGVSPSVAQPAGQFPTHFNPHMPMPLSFPHAPGLPNLGHIPPRMNSPSITRHIVPTNGTAIPSGSPDLPEGVVIPAGWSLMPLQRMDAGQGQSAPPSAPFPAPAAPASNGETSQAERPAPTPTTAHVEASDPSPRVANSSMTSTSTPAQRSVSDPSTAAAAAAASTPQPPTVVAPSPTRLPNWGGSAQLFPGRCATSISPDTSSETSSQAPPPPPISVQQPSADTARSESSASEHAARSSEDEKKPTENVSKGKAKAVSVESESESESEEESD